MNRQAESPFSNQTDRWFDAAANDSASGQYEHLAKMADGSPTTQNLEKFKAALKTTDAAWKNAMMHHIDKIQRGDYNDEFAKLEGPHSQISEFFSGVRQALRYNSMKWNAKVAGELIKVARSLVADDKVSVASIIKYEEGRMDEDFD